MVKLFLLSRVRNWKRLAPRISKIYWGTTSCLLSEWRLNYLRTVNISRFNKLATKSHWNLQKRWLNTKMMKSNHQLSTQTETLNNRSSKKTLFTMSWMNGRIKIVQVRLTKKIRIQKICLILTSWVKAKEW